MADGQEYELEDATYPLIADAGGKTGVTIGEEIQCLLDAGWTWDGDKLVHPKYKDVWTIYKRIDSHKIRAEQFDAEILQAVQKARQREERMGSGG